MSLVAAAATGALLWALPHAAQACSCVLPPPPAVAAERAEGVFEARVDGVQGSGDRAGTGTVRYDLAVLRVWKGELGAQAQLVTRASSAACGRSFVIGKRYLIYAGRNEDGEWTDGMCSRTRLSSGADEDLAVLGPGGPPVAAALPADAQSREPPRISPPPPEILGPAPVARRGCDFGGGGLGGAALGLWALVRSTRRRPRARGSTRAEV